MKHFAAAVAAAVTALTCATAQANDTTARVAAGGIAFLKTQDVRMVQETLEISPKRIRVRYRFLNESDRDFRATIAFPMPPYGWNPGLSALVENEQPMRSFIARVDGQPVTTQMLRQAQTNGRDITADLRALGLSEAQIFETFGDAREDGDGLTPAQRRGIHRLVKSQYADWQVAETMVWEQVFAAHREVLVEHEYIPFVGMVYTAPYQGHFGLVGGGGNLVPSTARGPEKNTAEACVQEGAERAVDKRVQTLAAASPDSVWVTLNDVEYVLGTGRNWRGPIGDFTLVIRKESPDQIVSLCFPGKPERTSPTTLEFRQSNFVPQDKLVVYFYSVQAR